MRVMVTGGAGYIGAHVVRLLQQRGDEVVVVDDLATGNADRIDGATIIQLDLTTDRAVAILEASLRAHNVDAVVHFAARKQVAESVERPAWYYQQNIGAVANVLMAMRSEGVSRLVFSSSAAVYGKASSSGESGVGGGRLDEESPTHPISPYGETKLVGEWLVSSAARADGLSAASLRYFNVAGAGWPELGDTAVLNLVPMVFQQLERRRAPVIFGDDYDTPDGTCIRDYVHVLDVAEAHLATLDRLGAPGHRVYNLGTGVGSSVREVIDEILRISHRDLQPRVAARRSGDAARVVASVDRIYAEVGWQARLGMEEIVTSAWEAHQSSNQLGELEMF
jgi:UDP-glucose 4-epimerase